jgi:hypothetical protein
MSAPDLLAAWRANPFFVLGVNTRASRAEVERAGQKLLGLLAVGSAAATRYDTPFGSATRDADGVRAALATLRDPTERVIYELMANVAHRDGAPRGEKAAQPWEAAERAIGWTAT